jgi:hypothetical protein
MLFGDVGQAMAQAEPAPAPAYEPFPTPQPETKKEREGFLLGGYVGFGSLDAGDESKSTVNYRFEIGGFLRPDWAISVGIWGGQHSEEFSTISNNNAGLMTQYWFREAFWLKGAIGTASLSVKSDGTTLGDYSGMAIGGDFGWNFYSTSSYHFDASIGFTFEGYEDLEDNTTATALVVGVQYY